MREFFNRMATSFVNLSNQATELSQLRQDFEQTKSKVDTLVNENERLRGEIYTLVAERDNLKETLTRVQRESEDWARVADESQKAADQSRAQVNGLKDDNEYAWTMVRQNATEHDKARQELQEAQAQKDQLEAAIQERDGKIAELNSTVNSLTAQVHDISQDRVYWRDRANGFEHANSILEQRLKKIQSVFDQAQS